MKIFTVYLRRNGADPDQDIVLVEEGFSFPALFFTIFWALWHRLWLVAAALLVIGFAAEFIGHELGLLPATKTLISFVSAFFFGVFAGDLRRHFLVRAGYTDFGVVSGRDVDFACRRFWDNQSNLAVKT
ncbi:MAG: hypothetical protein CBB68_08440 [Rhodospirillaceae bacterium TMED8]|nr:hypothetical protein [Magnetovibrio sp.]OUT50398.1 MAG: hypothetical protein CBB68_08440 [Rhodospirillaceae bacterium TMED8]|tara:strand:+ start:71 stop:457 length:387 start_codon:yes stop_codon:yes gene_type:complete